MTTVVLYISDLEPYRTRSKLDPENFLIENSRVFFLRISEQATSTVLSGASETIANDQNTRLDVAVDQ
jgi:hypothetical protein